LYGENGEGVAILLRTKACPSAAGKGKERHKACRGRSPKRAADQPYREFLDQRIFQPLQLTETFAGNAGDRPRVAAGHVHGKLVRSFELDTVGMGAGDVWSTVDDLMRWSRALFDTGFLSDASRRAMFDTQATLPSDEHLEDGSAITAQRYGYGWFLGRGLGKALVLHPGDNAGFKALNLFVPSSAVRLVMLVNDETSAFDAVAVELLTEALGPE
jgi:CubicO group peptidase (beta-lactamase class C family)